MDDMRVNLDVDPGGVQVVPGPERIVRALAAGEDPSDPDDEATGFPIRCHLCRGKNQAHTPDCPWRMATEWVAANPA